MLVLVAVVVYTEIVECVQNLKEVLSAVIPEHREIVKDFVKKEGNKVVGQVTLEQVCDFTPQPFSHQCRHFSILSAQCFSPNLQQICHIARVRSMAFIF